MAINLTDTLNAATTKGKLADAKQKQDMIMSVIV